MRQQYTSYAECIDFFKKAQKTNPDLFKVESIGTTWEDRDIIAVTITKDVKSGELVLTRSKIKTIKKELLHLEKMVFVKLASMQNLKKR